LHADILHAAAAEQDDGVFLQVVSHTRNIGLHTVRQTNASNLTNSGVRLSWGLGGHLGADTSLERRRIVGWAVLKSIKTAGQRKHARLRRSILAASLRELVDGGHLEKEDPNGSETI